MEKLFIYGLLKNTISNPKYITLELFDDSE
jgi:hypothetical protein